MKMKMLPNELTITVDEVTYIRNTETNYCFSITDNKKHRISRKVFDEMYDRAIDDKEQIMFDEIYEQKKQAAEVSDREAEKRVVKKRKRVSATAQTITLADNKEVILTEKQVDFLRHLPDSADWENDVDSVLWIDTLCDDIGGQFENKPMVVGAMVSTLCEKGIIIRVNEEKHSPFQLTDLGKRSYECIVNKSLDNIH